VNDFLPMQQLQRLCFYMPSFACVSSSSASPLYPALLTIFTLTSWIVFLALLSRPCPRLVAFSASAIILCCFAAAPAILNNWLTLVWVEAVITAVLLRGGDAKAIPAWPWLPLAPVLITRFLIQFYIMSVSPLSPSATLSSIAAFLAVSAVGSYKPFANPLSCYWAG